MPLSFLPSLILDRVTDVSPAVLEERGVTALLMDFDNTIVPYTTDEPAPEVRAWLEELRRAGVFLCVVSNSRKPRVIRFCEVNDLACVARARKPFSKGIREALTRYGLDPRRTALVGDQIFTDVLGGNCAGLVSVLITPICLHNIWLRLRHWLELPFIFAARRRKR